MIPREILKKIRQIGSRTRCKLVALASAGCLIAGVLFSHRIEPGIKVERVTVAGDTPAIRISPTTPGPHPIALLGHGGTGSKENNFRFSEALAAAGFDCYAIDFPGHGESRRAFSIHDTAFKPADVAHALGTVDVYLGHSMGGGAGAWSVREGNFRPRLFIAMGSNPKLGEHGPPLLLLAGRFDEFVRPAQLNARTDARVIISPWSDHVLEAGDPYLVNAAVEAACASVGKTPPPTAPTAWRWRLIGLVLGMFGAIGLIFSLPELHPQLARMRGLLIPAIIIIAMTLTMSTYVGFAPQLARVPLQLALMAAIGLALVGINRLKFPRWSITAGAAVVSLVSIIVAAYVRAKSPLGDAAFRTIFSALIILVATGFLVAATILGKIAARHGNRLAGDTAMTIFAGYAIGLWIPKLL